MKKYNIIRGCFVALAVVGMLLIGWEIYLDDLAHVNLLYWFGGTMLLGLIGNSVASVMQILAAKKGKK